MAIHFNYLSDRVVSQADPHSFQFLSITIPGFAPFLSVTLFHITISFHLFFVVGFSKSLFSTTCSISICNLNNSWSAVLWARFIFSVAFGRALTFLQTCFNRSDDVMFLLPSPILLYDYTFVAPRIPGGVCL